MNRAYLPFRFLPSRALVDLLGRDLREVAVLALRAVLKHSRGLEVAHQQVVFRDHHIALSTRVTAGGELIVDLDVGDPALAHRLVLEDELRQAGQRSRQRRGIALRQRP